jgi:hypothetical protein
LIDPDFYKYASPDGLQALSAPGAWFAANAGPDYFIPLKSYVHMQETGALQSLFWLLPPKARAWNV